MQTHANEAMHDGGSRGWSPWCTCNFSVWTVDQAVTLRCFESTRLPQSVLLASEPSSVFSPKPCRRQYLDFLNYFAEHVADVFGLFYQNHVADSFIYFDDGLGHGNHSGELLLFVGCIVNFVGSYLICMFQDSVPAGSYNDPFLSSVWCCAYAWQLQ